MKTTITTLMAIALFAPSLQAGGAALDFTSLPSAQGWTYHGNAAEDTVFGVAGRVLTQDTIGIDHESAYYSLSDVIDPNEPFIVSFRARVLDGEFGSDALAFAVQVDSGSQLVGVGLAQTGVTIFGPGSSVVFVNTSIDTSRFHDYVLISHPKVLRWQLWVDGRLVGRGSIGQAATGNAIYLGDLTDGGNARGEWTEFSFTQHRSRSKSSRFNVR